MLIGSLVGIASHEFDMSIRENNAYDHNSRRDIQLDEIIRTVRNVSVQDFLPHFPNVSSN